MGSDRPSNQGTRSPIELTMFFQTLYESSTALGFKRSMHIEEGKEVAVSFHLFSLCLHKILTFYIKSGASATCEATGGRQGELRKTSEL